MENERKKRKVENEEKRAEDDENEKMEKFFALIRSTRDMRDRLRSKEKDQDKKLANDRQVWNPSFRPEDFAAEDDKTSKSCLETQAGPSSATKREEEAAAAAAKKEREGDGLDLNLSL